MPGVVPLTWGDFHATAQRAQYAHPQQLRSEVESLKPACKDLSPYVFEDPAAGPLLMVRGTLFEAKEGRPPVVFAITLKQQFPNTYPVFSIERPPAGWRIKNHPNVDQSGLCYLSGITKWNPRSSRLFPVCGELQTVLASHFPFEQGAAAPPPAPQQQQQPVPVQQQQHPMAQRAPPPVVHHAPPPSGQQADDPVRLQAQSVMPGLGALAAAGPVAGAPPQQRNEQWYRDQEAAARRANAQQNTQTQKFAAEGFQRMLHGEGVPPNTEIVLPAGLGLTRLRAAPQGPAAPLVMCGPAPMPGPAITEPTPGELFQTKMRDRAVERQRAEAHQAAKPKSSGVFGQLASAAKAGAHAVSQAASEAKATVESKVQEDEMKKGKAKFDLYFGAYSAREQLLAYYHVKMVAGDGTGRGGNLFITPQGVHFASKVPDGTNTSKGLPADWPGRLTVSVPMSNIVCLVPGALNGVEWLHAPLVDNTCLSFYDFASSALVDYGGYVSDTVAGNSRDRCHNWIDHYWRRSCPVPNPTYRYDTQVYAHAAPAPQARQPGAAPAAGAGAATGAVQDSNMCAICFAQPKNAFLRPCGHVVTCMGCASRLRECPLCRQPVTETFQAFL